ncbi:hypothetical protein [Burkholderia cepacia]|uniref:hypothetical protein n=1 Tax=Burkholderia cepacia TaxID=292 RepID=UPI000A3EF5B5|nr:hypothetical protein [Burkholderia cepacia]
MKGTKILDHTGLPEGDVIKAIRELVEDFCSAAEPLERAHLPLLQDRRTGATYIECHIQASKLISLGTVDVPLDPEEQPEYRANRDIVEDHVAFEQMKEDAAQRRTFSNLVCEFSRVYDEDRPVKIVGGQHRFTAIKEALNAGVDELHGLKVYFGLDNDQRIDVQLISNTNIAVSTDLFDRMQETLSGPELRNWCQEVGLLEQGKDFADKRGRASPITVRAARTFIVNYFRGRQVAADKFDQSETTPLICKSGTADTDWQALKADHPQLWKDAGLRVAGENFAKLIASQRAAFSSTSKGKKTKATNIDFAEKAMNYAVLSAWAFTAGVLAQNEIRLNRHYSLKDQTGKDPLNALVLAKGRHKTDPENYRGLGYRTDNKERGRLAEVFFLQAEKGEGITSSLVDIAIKKYHAKEAHLEVVRAEQKGLAQ